MRVMGDVCPILAGRNLVIAKLARRLRHLSAGEISDKVAEKLTDS